MKRNIQIPSVLAAGVMIAAAAAAGAPAGFPDGRRFTVEKVFVAEDSTHTTSTETQSQTAAASATTADNPCVSTFGSWRKTPIRVWASDANAPGNLPENAVTDSVRYACAEWSCHSAIEFVHVATEAEADFTIRWVHLENSGLLAYQWVIGDYFRIRGQWEFVIARSEVYLNNNATMWTVGDNPIGLLDHWPPKFGPDGCQAEDEDGGIGIDLLALLTRSFGTGLGLDGTSACDATDPCHDTTMNDCISAGRFSRRALNPEDIAAIQSLY